MTIALDEQIACVKREIGMRQRVYPTWVARHRMTQDNADREIERMHAVLQTLEQLNTTQQPDAYAVRMSAEDGGYWVGIWQDESIAKHILAKGTRGEQLVAVKIIHLPRLADAARRES